MGVAQNYVMPVIVPLAVLTTAIFLVGTFAGEPATAFLCFSLWRFFHDAVALFSLPFVR